MSETTDLSAFLSQLPVDQLAEQVGASPQETRSALDDLVPALLGGMQANAADPAGAASLTEALGQHDGSLMDNPDVSTIDTADGQKIVGHVFGDQTDGVINALAGTGSANSGLIKRLLPIVAPLVLQWLGRRLSQRTGGATGGAANAGGGDLVTDLLGSILGGANQSLPRGGSGGLGDLLGGVLGGLLGGGRR